MKFSQNLFYIWKEFSAKIEKVKVLEHFSNENEFPAKT